MLLLGDLNSLEQHEPVTNLLAAGYTDAAAIDVPKVKTNFNSSHKFLNPQKTNGKQIDYIFVSPDISVKTWNWWPISIRRPAGSSGRCRPPTTPLKRC